MYRLLFRVVLRRLPAETAHRAGFWLIRVLAGARRLEPPEHAGRAAADAAADSGPTSGHPLPSRPGHGLWLVRQVADRMRILSGARGTLATVAFDLPARRKGQGLPAGLTSNMPRPGWGPCPFGPGVAAN